MKQYPTISKEVGDFEVYAFNKFDGSNIRAEYSLKKGFWKFGTRHRLLGRDEPILGDAVEMIKCNYDVAEILDDLGLDRCTCYFEFWGESSKFGYHIEKEPHYVTLIDLSPYKSKYVSGGVLDPKIFWLWFGDLSERKEHGVAPLLFRGTAGQYKEDIKNGTLEGMGFEGVVCKGAGKNTGRMFKIKTDRWLEALRQHCGQNTKLYEELL